MTYAYIASATYVMVTKDEVDFIIKGKLYTIKREGNMYYLVDEDGNRYKVKNYNIDCNDVIIVSDQDLKLDWDFEVDESEM